MLTGKIYNIIIGVLLVFIIILMVGIVNADRKLNKVKTEAIKAKQQETAALVEVVKLTNKLNNKQVEVIEKVNTVYVEKKVQEKPKIEYITKEVEKLVMLPSYSNVCFDATGLQYTNSIITRTYGNSTTTSSEPSQ